MLLLEYYLYCNGRYGQLHVDIIIFFAIAVFMSYLLKDAKIKKHELFFCSMMVVLVFIFAVNREFDYITSDSYDGDSYSISQKTARKVMDKLTEDKNSLYVLSNNEYYDLLRCFDTFETVPAGSMSNIFILSAYMYPSHYAVLESFGYDNIYANMCKENVYYVTSHGDGKAKYILEYIQKHYCETANYQMVDTIHGVNIYKFFEEQP